MLGRFLLIQVLTLSVFSLTNSPTWLSDSLNTGVNQIVTTTSSSNQSSSITFPSPFTSTPTCIQGIAGFQLDSAHLEYIYFDLYHVAQSASVSLQLYLYNGTAFTSFSICYLCYIPSVIPALATGWYSAYYSPGDVMYSGSGYRSYVTMTNWNPGSLNTSHTLVMIPVLNSLNLRRMTATTNFQFKIQVTINNSSYYSITHTTDWNCSIEYAGQYRITLDPLTASTNQITYFDSPYFSAKNNVSDPFSLVYSNPASFFAGINHFNLTGTGVPSFKLNTTSFVLTSSGYVTLNFSTFNFRTRSCPASTPYFMESELLCYSACPSGYSPKLTYNYCFACYRGCLTCTSSTSTSCSTCNTTANRALSGTSCPCAQGFYDSGVIQCSACSIRCSTCAVLSTNCTACPANSFRTLSGNTCPCNNGYVDTSKAVCDACGGFIPGCLACSSTTHCTSCDSTKYTTLNSSTFLCDCSASHHRTMVNGACACNAGNTDVGVAICATCSSQIPGCLACTSATHCTNCDSVHYASLNSSTFLCDCSASDHRTMVNGACVCTTRYADVGVAACEATCSVTGCLTCEVGNASKCIQCDASGFWELSGSACACVTGYTQSGSNCATCDSFMAACQECSSSTSCSSCNATLNRVLTSSACTCETGYAESSGLCVGCGSLVLGCSLCSSATVCTECNAGLHMELSGTACSCISGYTLVSSQCETCGSLLLGCLVCLNPTTCMSCDESKLMILSGGSCVCQASFVLVSGVCHSCNETLEACSSCSSPSVCNGCFPSSNAVLSGTSCVCADGYTNSTFGVCTICSSFVPMCSNCSSTSVCTACDSSLHAVLNNGACECASGYTMSDGECVPCGSSLVGCATCSSTTECTTCDQLQFMTLSGTSCICVPGYALQSGVCNTCNSTLEACTSCSSPSVCDACDSGLNTVLSGSSCVCADGYANSSGSCTTCSTFMPMCTNCSSTSTCTVCDQSLNAVLSGGYCNCPDGRTLVGSQCETCSSLMLGCLTCSSPAVCTDCDQSKFMTLSGSGCVCKAGYVLVSRVCNPCNSTLAGCTSCSDPLACNACDSNLNTILSGSNCVCADGYGVSSGSCKTCSSLMLMCLNCSNDSACTACDSSLHAVLNNGACECDSGYAMSNGACQTCASMITRCLLCSSASVCTSCEAGSTVQSGMCPLCSVLINGCANCSSPTVCTACDPAKSMHLSSGICACDSGYALDHNVCASCSSLIAHCQLCSSSTHCTSCVAGYYVNSALTCSVCSTQIIGCLVCSSGSVCTTCDTANHFTLSNSNICQCQTGYFFNSGTSTCGDCSAEILNCLQCTSTTSCSQCVSPLSFTGGRCTCSQANQYYDQSQLTCVNCNASCSTCSSSSVCLTCDSTLHRVLSGSLCVCKPNYQENSSGVCVSLSSCVAGFVYNGTVCVEICGDGILFDLACDDGNIESGDGCSSTCTIETNFTCRGGSATAPTKCSYNKPLEIKLLSTKKDLYANAINFTLKVAPGLKVLETFNFSAILTSNLPTSSITAYYLSDDKSPVKSGRSEPRVGASAATGTLIVCAIYVKSIQFVSASLQFLPPTSQDNTFDMKVSSSDFVVNPDNAPAYFYSDGTYSAASSMKVVLKVCMIVALVNLIVGLGFWKLVGVEATHVVQVLFLAGSLIVSLPPAMMPTTDAWPSLGYNKLFTDFPDLFNFDSPDMPETLAQMGVGARFAQNCNYMLAAQLAVLLVGGLLFLLSRAIAKCSSGLETAAKFVLNEVFMVVVLFNCMNVGFSLGLHILYWDRPQAQSISSQALSLAPAAAFLLMALVHYYVMYTREHLFGHNNKMLKVDKLSQCHPMIMFVARSLLGATLAGLREFQYGIIAPISVQVVYLVYVTAKRPYKKAIASIRGIVSEAVIVVTLGVAALYGSDAFSAQSVSESSWGEYANVPAWVLYSLIAATLLFHLGCQLFAMSKFVLVKNSSEVYPEETPKNEEGGSSKRLDRPTDLPMRRSTNLSPELVEASLNELVEERGYDSARPKMINIKKTRHSEGDMIVGLTKFKASEEDFDV